MGKHKLNILVHNYSISLCDSDCHLVNISKWGSPSTSDPWAKNTGQRASKGTVLTSQSLSPWCDFRCLSSMLASWRWQDINVRNPLWRQALLYTYFFLASFFHSVTLPFNCYRRAERLGKCPPTHTLKLGGVHLSDSVLLRDTIWYIYHWIRNCECIIAVWELWRKG